MEGLSKFVRVFLILALVVLTANLVNIFFYTPMDTKQGIIQKIFYIHVPSAINMYIGYTVGFIFSFFYLWKRKDVYDSIAYSSIEVGFVFAICVLVTGPLWAKGTWGKYWDYDPLLTSVLIIWFIYFSYLLLRKYCKDENIKKLFSAIVGVIGFIGVPVVHYSMKIWRGTHPSGFKDESGQSFHPSMLKSLFFSVIAFIILYLFIFLAKLRREISLGAKRVSN